MAVQERTATDDLAYARNQVNGEAMTRLGQKRETAVQSAELAGVVPFSVWNFNPIDVFVWKLGTKLTVPAATSKLGIKKTVPWGGKQRTASVMVFRELRGFSKPLSAQNTQGGDPQAPEMQYDWGVVHPHEQVRAFEYDYNERFSGVGGVLVFKGDTHTVGGSNDQIIHVPTVIRAKNGTLLYSTKEVPLANKLEGIFGKQKDYCFRQLQLAQDWSDDPEKRSSLHNGPQGFEAWGQFAIDMGWQDQGRLDWMVTRDRDDACIKCGKMRKSGSAMFCECGHAYDPFAAFMSGMAVDRDVLATLPEEKLKKVKHEMARRAKLFADLEPEPKGRRKAEQTESES